MSKFCYYCGIQLEYEAKFCIKCGKKLIVEETQTLPLSDIKSKKQYVNGEILVHKGLANWCKSAKYVENGQGVLTNKRFLYYKHTLATIIGVNFNQGDYDLEIPYRNIKNISKGKQGLGKILTIETEDGKIYKFAVFKYDVWVANISKYLI